MRCGDDRSDLDTDRRRRLAAHETSSQLQPLAQAAAALPAPATLSTAQRAGNAAEIARIRNQLDTYLVDIAGAAEEGRGFPGTARRNYRGASDARTLDIDATSNFTVGTVEYSIKEVAAAAGITTRTLRHYDAIGLLPARRVARNGYRCYQAGDLVRLQRILLLRELGLGLGQIASVLDGRDDDRSALDSHLKYLRSEQERIDRQIATVERTIRAIEKEIDMNADEMFDGFDHTQYREEVQQRWGDQAWQDSDRWWRGLDDAAKRGFLTESEALSQAWQQAWAADLASDSENVQKLAARHVRWIQQGWGGTEPGPDQIAGLAEMYVADERFAANYGGTEGAAYVRDALVRYSGTMQ